MLQPVSQIRHHWRASAVTGQAGGPSQETNQAGKGLTGVNLVHRNRGGWKT